MARHFMSAIETLGYYTFHRLTFTGPLAQLPTSKFYVCENNNNSSSSSSSSRPNHSFDAPTLWTLLIRNHRRIDLAGILGEAWRAPKVGRCRVGFDMGRAVLSPANYDVWGASWAPPSGVRGGALAEKGFWRILKATERSFLYNDKIWGGQFALASPTPNSGGVSPFPRDLRPCLKEQSSKHLHVK